MCTCIRDMDAMLQPLNGRLGVTFSFTRDGQGSSTRPTIVVEKIDTRSRVKPPLALPTFCPFCGERYEMDGDAA